MFFRENWLFAHSGYECTHQPVLWALMVLLIEIEAICQNASAHSHCFMLDLQAAFTGCIKTNVHASPQKEIHLKFLWGIFLQFRYTFKEKPQRDIECSRQHPALAYPLSFISLYFAHSTFQTHAFWMQSLLGTSSYFYYTKSSSYIGSCLCKWLPPRICYTC